MALTLLQIFPTPADLLALQPEELAGVLIEVIPGISQSAGFLHDDLTNQLRPFPAPSDAVAYPHDPGARVDLALAEAVSWLETQGLIVLNPGQPQGRWYLLTRRGQQLRTRVDVEAYRLGRTLPIELLQPALADKVQGLYLRGDHDTAVFQAFREVEMAVRDAGGFGNDMLGVTLMRVAFHPDNGPLTDLETVKPEREAVAALFAGAIGHAKNPPSHRDVNLNRQTAARLILFASHLLEIVETRRLFT